MTIEELWAQLGLDSLGSTAVTETYGAGSTLRSPAAAPVPSTADEKVRLSLAPPRLNGDTPATDDITSAADLVVVGRLGQGGMGTVLQARQPSLARDVAVKVPRRNASGSIARSLIEEARLAGSLEHPGIVPVHAIAFDGQGDPALVMRLVDGLSWSTLLLVPDRLLEVRLGRSAANRLEAHLHVFLQVCNAIAFAHGQGVLHRDLKPSNVLIGELGEVYVADWGVARRKSAAHGLVGLKGTPAYFAPEMCTGDDAEMDERTDVFLLGATLYEVIEGNPPYYRCAGLREAIAAAWMGVIPPLPPQTPEELEHVVTKAMAHSKADRFQSVLELRDAVAEYLRHAASHRLAATARASLERLQQAVAATASREQLAPLASASRFGFMHSLTEWPDNAEARAGLEATLELSAKYEVQTKNAAAARTLLLEMKAPPRELVASVERLEAEDDEASKAVKQFEKVRHDFDPTVAMRQRVGLILGLAVAPVLATFGPPVVPAWGAAEAWLGNWRLIGRTMPSIAVFVVLSLVLRQNLYGTRLNRRFMATIGVSLAALLANRALTATLGISPDHTLLLDLVVLAAVGVCQGVLFHAGFFVQAAVAVVAVSLALVLPGHEPVFFTFAIVLALLITLVTWTRWKSDVAASR